MIEMNAVAAGTELDAARDAGREGMSAGWCAWSAGDASLMFSLVVRPDVNMHAFHGLPFVAAMGMMDALVGTASTPGLGLAGKVGIQWPSDIVCGAPAFETSLARVAVNSGAGAAGMFGAVTVDIERSALSELGVDVADEALVETLAAAVLARVDAGRLLPTRRKAPQGRWLPCWASTSTWCRCWVARSRRCRPTACRLRSACSRAWTSGAARLSRPTPASRSFRPRPCGFAVCSAGRSRPKIDMTTRPSSACAGEGFAYLGNGLPAPYSSKLKIFRF